MLSPLGKAIRKARVDTETTQNELAQFLGFSTAYLSYLERGIKNPPVGINEKLKEFFGTRGLNVDFSREIAISVREIKVNKLPSKTRDAVRRLLVLDLGKVSKEKLTRFNEALRAIEEEV